MAKLILFTDGSVNTRTHIGYGAFLAVPDLALPQELLKNRVQTKRFEQTSSTKLELQTLLWALGEITPFVHDLIVYTDSQNIIDLPARRDRLERQNYLSRNNERLKHYQLYQEFFQMMDLLDCSFVKVRGHMATKHKNEIDQLFTLVDRASRDALRKDTQSAEKN